MDYYGDSEWVTLGECDSVQELMVVRGLLESEGIECICPAIDWTAGIRKHRAELFLQVRRVDEAKARAILDAPTGLSPADDDREA